MRFKNWKVGHFLLHTERDYNIQYVQYFAKIKTAVKTERASPWRRKRFSLYNKDTPKHKNANRPLFIRIALARQKRKTQFCDLKIAIAFVTHNTNHIYIAVYFESHYTNIHFCVQNAKTGHVDKICTATKSGWQWHRLFMLGFIITIYSKFHLYNAHSNTLRAGCFRSRKVIFRFLN